MDTKNLLERVFKTGDGVFAVDHEQRIIFWNQGAEKDGFLRWLNVTHTFVGPFDNHPSAVVHIFRDATAEIEAKRLLGSMAKQLSCYGAPQGREVGRHSPPTELTEREKQVLGLLAQGQGTSSVAKTLTISNTTARNHIQNILAKLGVHTRLEAVAYALRHSLVDPGPVSGKQALEEKV